MADTIAVVIQCFVKTDTLKQALEALLGCERSEDVDLILWHDGIVGSRREHELTKSWEAVADYLKSFTQDNTNNFRSIEIHRNNRNLGTCKTCQIAMDHGFRYHDFVVFAEDDVIFSRDALIWFSELREAGMLDQEHIWAIAGESIYFDARHKTIDQTFIDRVRAAASEEQLVDKYTPMQFIPSSSFATSGRRWAEFGETRGQPLGDEDVCERCRNENRYCLFPIVPRAKDIGMLHDLGYSVTIHTKAGVKEIKQTYLLAEDLLPCGPVPKIDLKRFTGDSGRLFRQTTECDSIEEECTVNADLAMDDAFYPVTFENERVQFAVGNPDDQLQSLHRSGYFYEIEQLIQQRNLIYYESTVLDLGANTGNHSIFYAKYTRAARVYAFEPDATAIRLLRKTVEANAFQGKIDLCHLGVAIGDAAGTVYLGGQPENNLGGTYFVPVRYFDDALAVTCVPLDSLALAGPISLIKIDVEGMEMAVLAGAKILIEEHRPSIAIEIHERNERRFWDWVEQNQYQVINLYRESQSLRNYVIIPRGVDLGAVGSGG
jgi:FkbM family methyltransferase